MTDYDKIVRDRQKAVRRQMDARRIPIKAVQFDGGWTSPSTVLSYFPADGDKDPATMSIASLFRLIETGALPTDLLSLLLPSTHMIVEVPEGVDHDAMELWCREFLRLKGEAHHPESPDGREIADCEDRRLDRHVATLHAVTSALDIPA